MKKKYAGYINLKPLNGVIYPSSIQNTIMKNFIENDLNFEKMDRIHSLFYHEKLIRYQFQYK